MARDLPVLEPTLVLQGKGYREVLIREMDAGKIPLSLGKKCPVECYLLLRTRPFLPRDPGPAENHAG